MQMKLCLVKALVKTFVDAARKDDTGNPKTVEN